MDEISVVLKLLLAQVEVGDLQNLIQFVLRVLKTRCRLVSSLWFSVSCCCFTCRLHELSISLPAEFEEGFRSKCVSVT